MTDYILDESDDGYGRVFVPRGPWQPGYNDLIAKQRIPVVRLSTAMGWRGTDVQFLRQLYDLRGVEIYSPDVRDVSAIASLRNLCVVGLDCDLKVPVELSQLSELRVVKATWKSALKSVLQCSGLKHLNLTNWPDVDLRSLASMTRLAKLQLTSRKLVSLRGITAFSALEWVDLHACPKLESIDEIRACAGVSHLEVTSCKGVRDISAIGELGSLRELHLDNDGDIETMIPLQRCKLLERLSFFGDTRVIDGKLSVLEQLPRLTTLVFAPRRHYDRTRSEILQQSE